VGIEAVLGRSPDIAINHSHRAIAQHTANHPTTTHLQTDVWEVNPCRACGGRPVSLLWASPDCRHFSRAKGKKPLSKRVRSLAWVVCRWAAQVQPMIICLENVMEFEEWGPLGPDGKPNKARKGHAFRRFVTRLESLGYRVEYRTLMAADFGTPTIRRRLFMVARRDGRAICWPEPTHGPTTARPWISALAIIDRSIPVPSILTRAKPLAAKTIARFVTGLRRFVFEASDPVFLQVPGPDGRPAKAAAWLAKHYTGVVGTTLRVPLGTITGTDHHSLCVAWIASYYGTGGQWADLSDPLPSIVGEARHALCIARIDGTPYRIIDLGMRMLTPGELAAGQGFLPSYALVGTKAQMIAGIGNSVCPSVAEALLRANLMKPMAVAA
jgi:DNA (cytosine-5)-methyltransferase 1